MSDSKIRGGELIRFIYCYDMRIYAQFLCSKQGMYIQSGKKKSTSSDRSSGFNIDVLYRSRTTKMDSRA
jgi:hypothetical protein